MNTTDKNCLTHIHKYRLNQDANANGTSLKGHITTTYMQLCSIFGEPVESDEFKVSGEWMFEDEQGNTFTVYDWKSTSLYDSDLPSVEDFRSNQNPTTFNIGGSVSAYEFIAWLEDMTR